MTLIKTVIGSLLLIAPVAKATVYYISGQPISQQFHLDGSYPEPVGTTPDRIGSSAFRAEIAGGFITFTDLDYSMPALTRSYSGIFTDPVTLAQKTIQTTLFV